ncbi:MAG: hypothetical protein RL180_60 [Pseudomonadota bacterium]|jgi:hypothetical protein
MQTLQKIATTALVSAMLLATGCATIINDKTQKVNIATSNGAKVKGTIDGVPFEAPGVVDMTRANQNKVIMVEDTACTKETIAAKKLDNVFFINVLSGGAWGSTTDYVTEKMWKYEDTITINCK